MPTTGAGDGSSSPSLRRSASGVASAKGAKRSSAAPKAGSAEPTKKTPGSGVELLAVGSSVEQFLSSGLLPVKDGDKKGLLVVDQGETVGSVVEQMYTKRLRSCVVSLDNGKREFFDCMDLSWCVLNAIDPSSGRRASEETPSADMEWEKMKEKLRSLAAVTLRDAMQGVRKGCTFERFDATGGLDKLLMLFRSRRRIPIYLKGELCRIVTASDILELCCRASEDTKGVLESTRLADIVLGTPGLLSNFAVSEDWNTLQVLQKMHESSVRATPVLSDYGDSETTRSGSTDLSPKLKPGGSFEGEGAGAASRRSARKTSIVNLNALSGLSSQGGSSGAGQGVVGQFDVAALRTIFVHSRIEDNVARSWWWEAETVSSNIFLEPVMDFLAFGHALCMSTAAVAPYHSILSDETLAKAIARTLAAGERSAVVTSRVESAATLAVVAGDSSLRPTRVLEGMLSSLGLVIAMLEVGLFGELRFDPAKPGLSTQRRSFTARPEEVSQPSTVIEKTASKVRFDDAILLDGLSVPTCPEHGITSMKYVKGEEGKTGIDFRALKEWVTESKALGAAAYCTACQRSFGKISRTELAPTLSSSFSVSSLLPFGQSSLSSLLGGGPVPARTRTAHQSSTSSVDDEGGEPLKSCLRNAGSHGPIKKSKTMEKLAAIENQNEERERKMPKAPAGGQRSRSSPFLFFNLCCTPCTPMGDNQQEKVTMGPTGATPVEADQATLPLSPTLPATSPRSPRSKAACADDEAPSPSARRKRQTKMKKSADKIDA